MKPKADFLIESSYEVSNRIGGIYTVIATKSEEMKRLYRKDYFTVGPYFSGSSELDCEMCIAPATLEPIFEKLKKEGVEAHFGTWLVSGRPQAILLDFSKLMSNAPAIKKRLKKEYDVETERCGDEITKRLVWGEAVGRLVDIILASKEFEGKKGVLHHHISGSPAGFLLDLKKANAPIGLVTTTHSTRLGRSMAAKGVDLVSEMNRGLKEGRDLSERRAEKFDIAKGGWRIITEHDFEKAAADAVDVFTSVSDITAKECGYVLGKKPDIVTPNGIDTGKYPTIEERAMLHHRTKGKIWDFLEAYFLPYYDVNIQDSLLLFISGRYEFHTKGYDVLIESLGRLNEQLKKEGYEKTLFVFVMVLDKTQREQNREIIENLAQYEQIEDYVYEKLSPIHEKIMSMLVHGNDLSKGKLLDGDFFIETKKLMARFRKTENKTPPVCIVDMNSKDRILKALKKAKLTNKAEDRVKIVYYPKPVALGDGFLSMNYFDAMAGMHLGVFPSYYEPWGYTPLEAGAYSLMSITTDLAGFGKFVKKNTDQREKPGILVLKRDGRTDEQATVDLTKMLHWFANLSKNERVGKKLEAKEISNMADWKEFSKYYVQAHDLAVKRCEVRTKSKPLLHK